MGQGRRNGARGVATGSFGRAAWAAGLLPVSFALAAGLPGAAIAAEWRITPRIEVDETYNDNITLAPKGREKADFITTISPGIGVRGTGRRVSLNLDYDPQALFFARESDNDQQRQRLRGGGQVELWEKVLFLDAQASINQQVVSSTGGVGGTDLSASQNLTTVQTYNIGPTFKHHFGPYADSETRYQFSAVTVDSENVADTTSNTASFVLRNGRYFTDLGWTLTLNESRTERSGGTATTVNTFTNTASDRRLAKADTRYAINSMFSLLAGVGYEKIKDVSLLQQPDGLLWDAGVLFRPSRTSSFKVTHGRRFGDPNTAVDVSYQIGPKTTLTASYDQTIQTSQGLLSDSLSRITVDEFGRLIDRQTGLPFNPNDPTFGLNAGAFRSDRFATTLNAVRGRNTFRFELFEEQREFDISNATTDAMGGRFNWTRRLTRATDLDLGATYTHTEFSGALSREDDFYSVNLALTYRLSDSLRGIVSAHRTERLSTAVDGDVVENLVSVRVRKQF